MVELALVEFQYHESRGSYYQHREPFPPNPLVAGVVELALVESQYDESRGSYP